MQTTSFSRVLCHHKFVAIGVNEYFLLKWRHVPCGMMSSIILSLSSLSTLNFEDMGGWEPWTCYLWYMSCDLRRRAITIIHGSSMTTNVSASRAPSCKSVFRFSLRFYAAAVLKSNFIWSPHTASLRWKCTLGLTKLFSKTPISLYW